MRSDAKRTFAKRLASAATRLSSFGRSVALVWVGVVTYGCIVPEATCEYTKTCVDQDHDANGKPVNPQLPDANTAAPTADGGQSASSQENGESQLSDASLDASMQADADASITERQECERLVDCPLELPVCHETERVCTQCDNDFDCKSTPKTPLCKLQPTHVQDNTCVQCINNGDCAAGICVNNACVACNTRTDDGCTDNLPHCNLVDEVPTCVLCETDEHCGPDLPVCADNQCVLCTTADSSHCPAEAPTCLTDETPARCVGCRGSNDCVGMLAGDSQIDGLCLDERCTVCELGTNLNCPTTNPFCVALLPEGDGGVTLFAPESATMDGGAPSEQYLSFEHQCVECLHDYEPPDDRNECGGSRPGCYDGTCVECTRDAHCTEVEASVCDTNTHQCVGCSDVGDCVHLDETPACDLANNRCVECTAERAALCGNKACQTVPGGGQYACSDEQVRSAGLCEACLSDAHCPTNSACVLEVYASAETGYRCLPIQGSWGGVSMCGDIDRFVSSVVTTSVDGANATFCRPRTTSCQGNIDYGRGPVTNDADLDTCNSNEDCGFPGIDDGICVPWTDATNRCTYNCVGEADCALGCINTTAVNDEPEQVCSLDL